VAGCRGIQHEALQHGVVGVARHVDAVAAHHVQVVLAVLAELALAGVFQQRTQRVQRLRTIQLRGRARAKGQRH
jgi:hypothetical protein